jgi:RimJ/RimL family protein N-acetyltransferase
VSDTEPVLKTERLELWRPLRDDFIELHALLAPESMRTFLGGPTTKADEFGRFMRGAGSWQLYGYGMFHVRERGRKALVGIAGVFHSWRGFGEGLDDVPEAGWIVGEAYWGQGYAREATAGALAWFERSFAEPRIACMIEDGNAASVSVAARLGFREYARHQPNEGRELVLYERLRS